MHISIKLSNRKYGTVNSLDTSNIKHVLSQNFDLDFKSDILKVYFPFRGGGRTIYHQNSTVLQVNAMHLTQALQKWSVEHYHH